ncbi:hypothetical protein M430DRAFT_36307 [Amorphotheca resinae ATCC 22711]|jgi:hypothetical protein|uniref:Peroxin 11C n=1 Tax=Amorphotheca resinae ATCC 22711 TaxID=857342 RepID=A0A2T3AWY8_AMORE|nr:hypothetical protein M430DRAFT_36307 [Amorphotheca resinae ATCC 22711]PSS13192.1 hypothetical protein M430DRAFT_36307 [Amorphotheca resinae ATCC 22711]
MSEIQDAAASEPSPEKSTPLPAPSSPPRTPSVETLQSWLPLYLKKADLTIDRLSTILSTPSGTDTILLTLGYSSLLCSTVLSSISLRRLQNSARQFIEKAISLPPNTALIIDTSAIPPSRLLIAAQRLKALSSLISDFRIFARLWGLIGIWKWGKSTLAHPPADQLLRQISYAQVLVNIFYQYLENGAYLSSKGVVGWSSEKQNKAWLWSSRFWMAHVALDFVRLYREYAQRKSRAAGEVKDDAVTEQGEAEWKARWRKEMVVNMAYAPLTLHWSLEKGLVGDFWVGLLGSIVGITGSRVLWKNTSKS